MKNIITLLIAVFICFFGFAQSYIYVPAGDMGPVENRYEEMCGEYGWVYYDSNNDFNSINWGENQEDNCILNSKYYSYLLEGIDGINIKTITFTVDIINWEENGVFRSTFAPTFANTYNIDKGEGWPEFDYLPQENGWTAGLRIIEEESGDIVFYTTRYELTQKFSNGQIEINFEDEGYNLDNPPYFIEIIHDEPEGLGLNQGVDNLSYSNPPYELNNVVYHVANVYHYTTSVYDVDYIASSSPEPELVISEMHLEFEVSLPESIDIDNVIACDNESFSVESPIKNELFSYQWYLLPDGVTPGLISDFENEFEWTYVWGYNNGGINTHHYRLEVTYETAYDTTSVTTDFVVEVFENPIWEYSIVEDFAYDNILECTLFDIEIIPTIDTLYQIEDIDFFWYNNPNGDGIVNLNAIFHEAIQEESTNPYALFCLPSGYFSSFIVEGTSKITGCTTIDIMYVGLDSTDVPFITKNQEEIGVSTSVYESFSSQNRQKSFRVYPNPTNGVLTLEHNFRPGSHIEIFSLTGQAVYNNSVNSNVEYIDLTHLTCGVYFAILYDEHERLVARFIKQ